MAGRGKGWGAVMRVPRKPDGKVERARELRRAMTDAEKKLWWHLRQLPVETTHFRRQAAIGPYFADFACHKCRLLIEVDGGGHNEARQIAADKARTAYLKSRGYRVLRFWNNEVLKEIDGVMSVIYDAVHQTKVSPTRGPRRASAAGCPPYPSPPIASRMGGGEAERSRKRREAAR
jgi:very-short-patch-repair endonuclease